MAIRNQEAKLNVNGMNQFLCEGRGARTLSAAPAGLHLGCELHDAKLAARLSAGS